VRRCVATRLPTRDRRAALLSLNTVETHIRELYRNPSATSRAAAFAGVQALGLLDLAESPG
jgi:hypothetical protein